MNKEYVMSLSTVGIVDFIINTNNDRLMFEVAGCYEDLNVFKILDGEMKRDLVACAIDQMPTDVLDDVLTKYFDGEYN